MEKLATESRATLILLEYHIKSGSDNYWTAETLERKNSYNIIGTPAVVLNGAAGEKTLYGITTSSRYKSEIDKIIGQKSQVYIDATINENNRMAANVRLTNVSEEALENLELFAVVYQDMGQSQYHYVVKDLTPTIFISLLDSGATTSYELASSIDISADRHMVVILKSAYNLVLQAFEIS